jgi:hypothetical protein
LLRKKASGSKSRRRSTSPSDSPLEPPADTLTTAGGHINFFVAEEAQSSASTSAATLAKKMKDRESERGIALAPDKKDLLPWYASKDLQPTATEHSTEEESAAARYKAKRKE